MTTENDEPTGRAKGGHARAESLSDAEKSEIASNAAKARWESRRSATAQDDLPHVLEGYKSELQLAGIKLPCAVISGPNGVQRVLTENGITLAILGERSGASKRLKKAAEADGALLPLFVAPSQLKPFIDNELASGPLLPIDYRDGERVIRGYDASVLVAVCNIWLRAREAGALQNQQLAKAQKAEILTRALAETGIVALVDEPLQTCTSVVGAVSVKLGDCEQFEHTSAKSWLSSPEPVASAAMLVAVIVIVTSPVVPTGRNTAS